MRRVILVLLLLAACSKSAPAPAVHGWVVPGSIESAVEDEHLVHTFTIEEKGKQTHVRHVGSVSNGLRDSAGVTVRGPIKDGVLQATEMIFERPEGEF